MARKYLPPNTLILEQRRDPLLTSAEVAKLFHVKRDTVKHWAAMGKIRHSKTLGGHLRFRRSDVERLIEERQEHYGS